MSVLTEHQRVAVSEPVREEPETLVFAASSIVREMSSQLVGRPVREIVSDGRRYRMEGRRLQTADASGPVVLVFVEPMEVVLPNDDELRQRFGLTRKEACVACLIAEDQTNEQIANRLSISPHTARHHTERILAKLGVRSRTLVRRTLIEGIGQ